MEEYRTVLKDVFGESSDSEGDELHKHQIQFESPNNGVQSESIFGENPSWERLAEINGLWLCRDFLSLDQQSSLLSTIENEGWFTEASHNQGICAHVDLMRFEDGIAIVSLESSCVMHFSRVESDAGIIRKESEGDPHKAKIPVFLTPGSLVLMWGEARYLWKHEINRKPGFQKWEGKDIDQKRRTSITLRKLCHSE